MQQQTLYEQEAAFGIDAAIYGKYITLECMEKAFQQSMEEANSIQDGKARQAQKDYLQGRIDGYHQERKAWNS